MSRGSVYVVCVAVFEIFYGGMAMRDGDFKKFFDVALLFHGHRCPAMPLGLRAGFAAMERLGVERSKDKELHVISETGKGHAAGCFLDGIMMATGCTYGKSNIEKLYYNKMAFRLIDVSSGRSLRVSLKPEFFASMLKSPFLEYRKRGIPPQDVPSEVADPLVERALTIPEGEFLVFGNIERVEFSRPKGVFEVEPCAVCGELTFVDKLFDTPRGKVCTACRSGE